MTTDTPDQQFVPAAAPAETATTAPPPLPLVDQVADLRTQIDQQNRHIRFLHGVVDQLIDELNRQTGMEWKPDVAEAVREDVPTMQVTADHSRRGRRAEAKFTGGQS